MNLVETTINEFDKCCVAAFEGAGQSYKKHKATARPEELAALAKCLFEEDLPKAIAEVQMGIEKIVRDIYNNRFKSASPKEQSALAEQFYKDIIAFKAALAKRSNPNG